MSEKKPSRSFDCFEEEYQDAEKLVSTEGFAIWKLSCIETISPVAISDFGAILAAAATGIQRFLKLELRRKQGLRTGEIVHTDAHSRVLTEAAAAMKMTHEEYSTFLLSETHACEVAGLSLEEVRRKLGLPEGKLLELPARKKPDEESK